MSRGRAGSGRAALGLAARCLTLLGVSTLAVAAGPALPAAAQSPPSAPASAPPAGGPFLQDATRAAGLAFEHENGARGELYFGEIMGSGLALLDYDGDGDLDLYLLQGHELAPGSSAQGQDVMLRNDLVRVPEGRTEIRLVDVTARAAIPPGAYSMGVAAGDVNGDGLPDLYAAALGPNRLLLSRGDGSFEAVPEAGGARGGGWSAGAAFADLDDDGRLDLYVASYADFTPGRNKLCPSPTGAPDYCSPAAYEPLPDRLFLGRGDGTFEDVSVRSGIAASPASGLGVVSADFDGDGRLDLYVANDGMGNHLFLNQGDGTFLDEAILFGAAVNAFGEREASMGIALGDVDLDGDEDLLLTHLKGETHTLYRADGGGLFTDVTDGSGLSIPSWGSTGFGAGFFDLENDGDLDLYVANGHVTLFAGQDKGTGQENQLFRNRGNGTFDEVPARDAGSGDRPPLTGRGAAFGDLDRDGDVDVVVTNNGGPAQLLLSLAAETAASSPGTSWMGVSFHPAGRPGTRVEMPAAEPGDPPIVRHSRTDGSYASAQPEEVHLTAPGGVRDRLRITFSDGTRRELRGLPPEVRLRVSLPSADSP